MTITIHAQGTERKRLVNSISEYLEVSAKYCGASTFNYEVGYFTVAKDGNLSFDDSTNIEAVESLLEHLAKEGFDIDQNHTEDESAGLTITVPIEKVSVNNLTNLLAAKGELIKKALGVDALPVEVGEGSISFPWFSELPDADDARAYTAFIAALCRMSHEQKRICPVARAVKNENYAFRCFFLRLGFIGDEYKTARKILLRNLTGCAAWNGGAPNDR